MNILLTGGTGFVGIAITEKLLQENCRVVVFDRNRLPDAISQTFESFGEQFVFIEGDVLDARQVMQAAEANGIDTVIHAAAVTPDKKREILHGKSIIDVNCGGLVNVMEAASELGVTRFFYISTGAVYGEGQWQFEELFEEQTSENPNTYYEITKFASERIALRYQQLTGLNVLILRLGDVFGAWEYLSGARDIMSAPFQVTRLALKGETAILPRPGLKNWVYSRDIATCIFDGLSAPALNYRIYHLSAPYQWSIEQWCGLLAEKYTDFAFEIAKEPTSANVVFSADHAPMNIDRLRQDFGTELTFDLHKSFDDYTEWAESHTDFLNKPLP